MPSLSSSSTTRRSKFEYEILPGVPAATTETKIVLNFLPWRKVYGNDCLAYVLIRAKVTQTNKHLKKTDESTRENQSFRFRVRPAEIASTANLRTESSWHGRKGIC